MVTTRDDFADPEQARNYPAHGWAKNTAGLKVLRLPIVRLFRRGPFKPWNASGKPGPTEQTFAVEQLDPTLDPRADQAIRLIPSRPSAAPFESLLRELALTLAQLHAIQAAVARRQEEHAIDDAHTVLLAPRYVRWALIDLRSLLDLFAIHLRHQLFDRPDNLGGSFDKLSRKPVDELARAEPRVDPARLSRAFANSWTWYDLLRDPARGNQGMRDALVHGNIRVLVSIGSNNSEPPRLQATLSGGKHFPGLELISTLLKMIAGLAQLFSDVHAMLDDQSGFRWDDRVVLHGCKSEDQVGFWPEIERVPVTSM